MVSKAFLPQAIAEIEHMITSDGGFVIFGFMGPIDKFLHEQLGIEFNCGLHLSKTVLVGAVEGVKNAVLDWAIRLEEEGVLGEGLRFSTREIEKAQNVTNHIYGSNIGVLGGVGANASVSHQTVGQAIDFDAFARLVAQIREAVPALPYATAKELDKPIAELENAAKAKNITKVRSALAVMVPVLQGATGNLAASGVLAAISSL